MNVNNMIDFTKAEQNAVELSTIRESKELSSNFIDIATDCCGDGVVPKSEIQNRYPLVAWLLGTPVTSDFREKLANGICGYHKNANGEYEVDLPRSIWSDIPNNPTDECCWTAPDFSTCGGKAELRMVCLKDCNDIKDDLMWSIMRAGNKAVVPGISSANDTIKAVNDRINRLSMAFYSAYTIALGTLNNTTNILKPFNGVMQVLTNPAVAHINGADILAGFQAFACRMPFLGNASDYAIFVNPLGYQTLLALIREGRNGQLPYGWTRSGDEIRYQGIPFMQDVRVPVDFTTNTTEAWILNRRAIGLFLGGDLMPEENSIFTRTSGHQEQSLADGCGSECKFYYNIGAVINTDARPLAVIQNMPVNGICVSATNDMHGLIQPETLMPRGV